MGQIGARDLTVAFGTEQPLLDGVTVHLQSGERVALVGRNGAGKSTLLKVLAGDLDPVGGEVVRSTGLTVARLSQEIPEDVHGPVVEVVASGLPELGALLAEYHRLSHNLGGDADLARLQKLQDRIDAAEAWDQERRVEAVISRLALPEEASFETLSGGLKRRVLLGRALVSEPDVLLLDEPTNHLDVPAIEWLEEMLATYPGTLVFVTHDRAFLRALATRILEVDRGGVNDYPGNYALYEERRAHNLAVEAEHAARFDKKLAQEETWIRQGIKARRTRNEGRVRALEKLREERKARRALPGQARLRLEAGEASGKMVVEAQGVSFAYEDKPIVRGLTTTIVRGDKVGILGPNGSGKTTLLNLLLGKLEPDSGTIRHGSRLEVAYFDQHRDQLDLDRSVADNVANGADKVTIDGKTRHIISYLESFLFPPGQVRSPVRSLSGGERNRLLLARLFTRSFNVLVMDEPTNDLDVETLELLEALLVNFEGTLLLVSHDRAFLDNVVTSTLVMEGKGKVGEYAGGYSDWLIQSQAEEEESRETAKKAPPPSEKTQAQQSRAQRQRKLSYREKQDLEALPGLIEALEKEQSDLHAALADPDFYRDNDGAAVAKAKDRLAAVETELEAALERWIELEALPG